MEKLEETARNDKRSRFDRSDLMSFVALLLSLGAFSVSVYEAGILREQQALMQEQKKAAVWPFLEQYISYSFDDENASVSFKLKNKGVGPARIKTAKIVVNGEEVIDYNTLIKEIQKIFPKGTSANISYSNAGGVLSANDEQRLLKIQAHRFENDQEILSNIQLAFQLCYCSIYEDCWTITEKEEDPKIGCAMNE